MTFSALQKASKDMPGGLTSEEIGDLTSVEAQMNQISRVKPFQRSSKLHTHSQNELSDHKFHFSPKHHSDSHRNIPQTVQPLVGHSFKRHRGRPKSHLSTSSRLYNHMNKKVLKSYSHLSSEEHLSRDHLKNKNNNTEKCIPTVECNKSFIGGVKSPKEAQLTHYNTCNKSSPIDSPIVPIPQRRGRGRPRKNKINDIQTSSASSTLNISSIQQSHQDSSLISTNSTPTDVKRKHSDNATTLSSSSSHDHYSRTVCVNNNTFENANLSMSSIQSGEYEHSHIEESLVKMDESNCSQYNPEFSNNEPIVLLNIASSTTPSSSLSPISSGSSCKTLISKTAFVSKKKSSCQKPTADIQSQSNKLLLSHIKMDKTTTNDEDNVYNNDSGDENVEQSNHHRIIDNVANDILIQVKKAAEESAATLKRKYECITSSEANNEYVGPKIVYLNCSNQGEISAIECPKARSCANSQQHLNPSEQNNNDDISENEESLEQKPKYNVSYPPFLVDLLTKSKSINSQKMDEHTLSKQKILDDLNKLKYNLDEPIAGAIHGPLTIFSPIQLAQLSDIYGGDPSVIEYAISLLKFVQPIGRWARRWAAKKLDTATDGLHSQACYTLLSQTAHTIKPSLDNNNIDKLDLCQSWIDVADITIDPLSPKVDESDTEHLEPCLVDLLNQHDTILSCNDSSVQLTNNESVVSCVPEIDIPYVKKDNLDSINTLCLSDTLDIPVSFNNDNIISNSQLVSNSTLNVSNIPQQNSSTEQINNELDDVIMCDDESIPTTNSIHMPDNNNNNDVNLPQCEVNNTIQQSEQLSLITNKLSEDDAIVNTDEHSSSSVKSTNDITLSSNTPSINEHEFSSIDHVQTEQITEIPTDNSTSLLKTALSGSSFPLNTSHDRISLQNKGIVDGSEDSSTHSLFLDSHLITHKQLPVSISHIENQDTISQCNVISHCCDETKDSLVDDCVIQNSCEEIFSDNRVDIDDDCKIVDTVESSHSLMVFDNNSETSEQSTVNNNNI
ncbi:unnamed protein product [Schistosoma turkestanicum]|nr:unnamed protein product [Schistosoma turkestanicum]